MKIINIFALYSLLCFGACGAGLIPEAAAQSRRVFYGDDTSIKYLPTTGGTPTTLVNAGFTVNAIAVDEANNKIYWFDRGNGGQIRSINPDGSGATTIVTNAGGSETRSLVADGTGRQLYFSARTAGKIRRVNYDGSNLVDLVTTDATGIAVDFADRRLYYTTFNNGLLVRTDLDGLNPTTIYDHYADLTGVALDRSGGKIFYSSTIPGYIRRIDSDGNNAVTLLSQVNFPYDLIFDSVENTLFYIDTSDQLLVRANSDGTNPTNLVTFHISAGLAVGSVSFEAPTPTALPTSTPTQRATPSNTPTSTPTPIATPMPTTTLVATPTSVATVAPEPTSVETAVPEITQTPDDSQLIIIIIVSNINDLYLPQIQIFLLYKNRKPVENSSIYVFDSRVEINADGTKRTAVYSGLTDQNGMVTFNNLPPGSYVVQPNLPGFSFDSVPVPTLIGTPVEAVIGTPVDLNDEGCSGKDVASSVIGSDQVARQLVDFTFSKVASFSGRTPDRALRRSLQRAHREVTQSYSALLKISQRLPKVVLQCEHRQECRQVSYRRDGKRYRQYVDNLRRLAFFVLRKGREETTSKANFDGLARTVRRLHRAAAKATKGLPSSTSLCSAAG